jgi:hypothetical protein
MIRLALAALLFSTAALAQSPARVESLSWMSGGWVAESPRATVKETWLGPGNGLMVAVNLSTFANGKKEFEFLRIADTAEGFSYYASPNGRSPATEFKMKEVGDKRVVFENAAHDFPQRIHYWREGEFLWARIEGTVQGKERSMQWKFTSERPAAK